MAPYSTDTAPEIENLQFDLLRQTPPWRRLQLMAALTAAARRLALNGLKSRFPKADEKELRYRFVALLYGEELAAKVYGTAEKRN